MTTRRRLLAASLGALLALAADDPPRGPRPKAKGKAKARPKAPVEAVPPLNRAVAAFARARVGEKVGNGECTTLATAALRDSGAELPAFQGMDHRGDFAWGTLVATITPGKTPAVALMPGDILQFRDARLVSVSKGRGMISTRTRTYPHHTAVVATADGRALTIFQQNVGDDGDSDAERRIVREDPLPLPDLKAGTIWAYRPVPGAPEP